MSFIYAIIMITFDQDLTFLSAIVIPNAIRPFRTMKSFRKVIHCQLSSFCELLQADCSGAHKLRKSQGFVWCEMTSASCQYLILIEWALK